MTEKKSAIRRLHEKDQFEDPVTVKKSVFIAAFVCGLFLFSGRIDVHEYLISTLFLGMIVWLMLTSIQSGNENSGKGKNESNE